MPLKKYKQITKNGFAFTLVELMVKAGLDTLVTGEADYPTEVKARELGINLVLAGHAETETFGVRALAERLRAVSGDRR